jgi:hypothetical protein
MLLTNGFALDAGRDFGDHMRSLPDLRNRSEKLAERGQILPNLQRQ